MDSPLLSRGAAARAAVALTLGMGGTVRAGMELQPPAAAPPVTAPAPAPASASPRPRAGPAPVQRQDERSAWTPCIRLINAAALGAEIDSGRRRLLLEQCAP